MSLDLDPTRRWRRLEQRTGFQQHPALANYIETNRCGVIENPVRTDLLGFIFITRAIAMRAVGSWRWPDAFSLAQFGRGPSTGMSVVMPERARRINAVMLTCGRYDGSGEIRLSRRGCRATQRESGRRNSLAVAPGKASIAVRWSAGMDAFPATRTSEH